MFFFIFLKISFGICLTPKLSKYNILCYYDSSDGWKYKNIIFRKCSVLPRSINNLTKWLSVHLRTKWFWVSVPLQSLNEHMFWELLVAYYIMTFFQVFIKFWSSERNTKNMMPHLYFNEESDYSEENTCENEVFCSTILHHRKKLKIFTSQLPVVLHTVLE